MYAKRMSIQYILEILEIHIHSIWKPLRSSASLARQFFLNDDIIVGTATTKFIVLGFLHYKSEQDPRN
jgi:hypothetical protein